MKNFWQQLPKPILIQAPMDDVMDTVFRQIIAKCGKPDLFFTEFTSIDALFSEGREKAMSKLQFTEMERPIIAQIWGNNPKLCFQAAKLMKNKGFDGIDINMGCPDKTIVKKGCCSGLIKNFSLVTEIIQATKEGAEELPVSVKTRLGYDHIQTEEWIGFLLKQNLDAITIHGRVATQMSKFPANWDEIGKVVKLRNQMQSKTIIIGNGDVKSRKEALGKYKAYGVDGVMIGRGILNNTWMFNKKVSISSVSLEAKLQLLVEHLTLFDKTWGNSKNFELMKKFYKTHIHNFRGSTALRTKLLKLRNTKYTLEFIYQNILANRRSSSFYSFSQIATK